MKTNVKTPTLRERRRIVHVTLVFILASGVLHMVLGGAIHPPHFTAVPAPSVDELILWRHERPRPSPTPKPTPSPTPPQKNVTPKPQPVVKATSMESPVAPHPPITPPTMPATNSGGVDIPSPEPVSVSPAPSAPADYRYVVVSARFINRVQPVYPEEAQRTGEEGTVIVLLTIGPDGVNDVRIWESSGYPALDREALRAAKESTYSVPEVNGEPATETYRVIYTFSINS
jgi:protein TonB